MGLNGSRSQKRRGEGSVPEGGIQVLLCTEAASEGINLQTCGVLITEAGYAGLEGGRAPGGGGASRTPALAAKGTTISQGPGISGARQLTTSSVPEFQRAIDAPRRVVS
jgi:hypothetical protein